MRSQSLQSLLQWDSIDTLLP
jgi:chorismate synthase